MEGDAIRFSVTDTGGGIPADRLDAIFGRFEKAREQDVGTGLGLSISKGIVERLGGSIGVESVEGEGSTFYFTLPYREVPEHMRPHLQQVTARQFSGRKTLLITEPSDEDWLVIESALCEKYDLARARTCDETVTGFIFERPDMVLANITLAGESGIEAIRRIRTISSSVPMVGVASNSIYMQQQEALAAGCRDIIHKPYSPSHVEQVVGTFI